MANTANVKNSVYAIESEVVGSQTLRGQELLTPTAATTIALTISPPVADTIVSWTSAQNSTINLTATGCLTGQKLTLIITSDASIRTMTWGTLFAPVATTNVTVASKIQTSTWIFNGTSFVQIGSVVNLA